ncbi:MAG: autotransporter-associated beta strand repeat-containing protein [Tepidisphaeraceae bacterium]
MKRSVITVANRIIARRQSLTAATLGVLTFTLAAPLTGLANTSVSVNTDATDLSSASNYSTGSLPTSSSDVVLDQTYTNTTLNYNTSGGTLAIGTLNNLYTTSALTIANTAGTASAISLNAAANSVSGNAADLVYVAPAANLTIGSPGGSLGLVVNTTGNLNTVYNGSIGTGSLTINSNVSGTGGLNKTGTGYLYLNGTNTFAGPLTLSAGQTYVTSVNALGNGGVNLSGGFLLYTGATDEVMSRPINTTSSASRIFVLTSNNSTLSINGGITATLGSGTQTLAFTGYSTGTVVFNGNLRDNPNVATNTLAIYANPISSGATYVFGGVSTYSGGTTIDPNGGTVAVASSTAFGSGDLTFIGTNAGGTFRSNDSTSYTIPNRVVFRAGTTIFGSATTGNLRFSSTAASTLPASRFITVQNTTEFDAAFNGAGSIYKNGSGTLVLAGTNTYTGGTVVNAGTLQVGNGGTTGTLPTTGSITLDGTLAFNRSNTITQGVDFGPVIANTTLGYGYVNMVGTGKLVLSGNNTYSGATTITAGTVEATSFTYNNMLNASEGVDLGNSGGKLVLNYTGTTSPIDSVKAILEYGNGDHFATSIIRSTTITANHTIGYGDDGVGAVTVRVTLPGDADLDGDVDFNDFLSLQANFGSANTRFDQGNFNYDGITDFNDFLSLQANFGQSLSGDTIAATSAQLAAMQGFALTAAVPEPAIMGVLALAFPLAMCARRSDRRA